MQGRHARWCHSQPADAGYRASPFNHCPMDETTAMHVRRQYQSARMSRHGAASSSSRHHESVEHDVGELTSWAGPSMRYRYMRICYLTTSLILRTIPSGTAAMESNALSSCPASMR